MRSIERQAQLDMRPSLLDIKVTPNRETPQPATVIRVHIQPRNGDRGDSVTVSCSFAFRWS